MAYNYAPYQKKQYQQSDQVNQAQQALQQHQQNKPGEYQSQWQQQMDDLLGKYQNRQPFQYDINADAMYQQMVDRYVQQGKQAMMDTVGQAAALTGGYGNSYAQTAGQQTYQGYLQGVNDMMPQFYQMALDRYQDEGEQLLNQYNLMANQEDMAYSRYNDTLNRYLAELDRLQGVYDSERDYDYGRFQNDQAFDYGLYTDAQNMQYQLDRDATEDARYDQEWAYQQERDRIADEQWQKQFDESVRQYNESMAWQKQQAASRSSGGGGSGGSTSGNGTQMTSVQAALLAARASAQGANVTQIINALKSAGLSADQASQAIINSKKVTLEGNGGKFASRGPR